MSGHVQTWSREAPTWSKRSCVVFPFESMCSFPNASIYHGSDTQIAHVALLGLWWQVISNARPGSPAVSQLSWLERTANNRKVRGSGPRGTIFFI